MTSVICAFPGVGKTWLYEHAKPIFNVSDSDSSKHDKAGFPDNYINHLESIIPECDFITISSHAQVRAALRERGIQYSLVYPKETAREEYLERYRNRGNEDDFVELLSNRFEEWVASCRNDPTPYKYELNAGYYLKHVLLDILQSDAKNYGNSVNCLFRTLKLVQNKQHEGQINQLDRLANIYKNNSQDSRLSPRQRAYARDQHQNALGIIAGLKYARELE